MTRTLGTTRGGLDGVAVVVPPLHQGGRVPRTSPRTPNDDDDKDAPILPSSHTRGSPWPDVQDGDEEDKDVFSPAATTAKTMIPTTGRSSAESTETMRDVEGVGIQQRA